MISVSIVSHGQGGLVNLLLEDLRKFDGLSKIILTLNIPEEAPPVANQLRDRVIILRNALPQGFAKNHNSAFAYCETPYFCVINPDVRIHDNPFPELVSAIEQNNVGMSAPLVTDREGNVEDSMRLFPTPFHILLKAVSHQNDAYKLKEGDSRFKPEWVAGMCMLFRRDVYEEIGGFDEGFFLYYEDVDICVRLWKKQIGLIACPKVTIIHDARRASHRNLRYFRWHLGSMMRFFLKHWGRLPRGEAQARSGHTDKNGFHS